MKNLNYITSAKEANNYSLLINLSSTSIKSKGIIGVNSFEEASALQTAYTEFFNLGASEFTGGLVSKTHYISYNGRIFKGNQQDWKNSEEVKVNKQEVHSLALAYFKVLENTYFN